MLAKDGADQTVKVARGLHDLSEMEGVKVHFHFLQVFATSTFILYLLTLLSSR